MSVRVKCDGTVIEERPIGRVWRAVPEGMVAGRAPLRWFHDGCPLRDQMRGFGFQKKSDAVAALAGCAR